MDTLTHIALGACIGEGMMGRKIGKHSLYLGAVAQSLPDIDFFASFFTNPSQNLLAHRGFTHSLLFSFLVVPLIAYFSERGYRPFNVSHKRWLLFFAVQFFVHLFIDGFNNYGVGWLEPFSHIRISFNAIYVVDPFFSIWPIAGCICLIFFRSISNKRMIIWKTAILFSGCYLMYCLFNKWLIERPVLNSLSEKHIEFKQVLTTPAPLQSWLWYIIARTDSGFFVGYYSVFDTKKVELTYYPKNEVLLTGYEQNNDIKRLKRFAHGFYTIEKYHDTLVFNDLRFGQEIGWYKPYEKFAFHYYIGKGYNNVLVVQRGRFAGWNKEVLKSLWDRARGN